MGFLDKVKSVAKGLVDKKLADLESAGIDRDFISALPQGKVVLSEAMLNAALSRALDSQPDLTLTGLSCTDSAIELAIQARKMGAVVNFPLTIRIQSLELVTEKQHLTLAYAADKPVGESILGIIAVALAAEFLKKVLHGHIENLPAVLAVVVDEQSHKIEVDLSRLPQVEKLTRKLPTIGMAPLDFVRITGATHIAGAVQLQGEVPGL